MKTNLVKQKLRNGEPTFGTWLTLGHLHAARMLARAGFDWLTVDMQHAPFDWDQAAALFAAVADAGCVPLCRVPEDSHASICRALDAGSYGVVVPMVNTVEEGRAAMAAAYYPPLGNRSLGGSLHALNFAAGEEYYARANEEILVVLQIESPMAVENAEAILALPGCDALFIGPNDLRARMAVADSKPTAADFESMVDRVVAAGRQARKPSGIHVMDPDNARARAAQGMQFIAVGSDWLMLASGLEAMLRGLGEESDPRRSGTY
ncbi:MAG: HpcH/HpaI aldolase family protein [Planctomycetota bacterium]